MSTRVFFIGLSAAFLSAWLLLLINPFGAMADYSPIPYDSEVDRLEGTFPQGERAKVAEGSKIYMQEGCAQCHTQVQRPEYIAPDTHRPLASGTADGEVDPRATHPLDFRQMDYAPLGIERLGQDLANIGVSRPDEDWHYLHLYAPQAVVEWSTMPGYDHLFEVRPIVAEPSEQALQLPEEFTPTDADGNAMEVVPTARAKALVEYLLQLRLDEPLPLSEVSPAYRKLRMLETSDSDS